MSDNERLAAVEVKVQNVQEGVYRVEDKVSEISKKLDDGYVRKGDFEKEIRELNNEIQSIKAKKTMIQVVTAGLLMLSLMLNTIAVYQLFTSSKV